MVGFKVLAGAFQALGNQIDIGLRGPDAGRALLLEGMQDINDAFEPHGVDRPKGVPVMPFNDLEYARPFAFPGLGLRVLAAELGQAKRISHVAPHIRREVHEIRLGRPNPMQGLLAARPGVSIHTLEYI